MSWRSQTPHAAAPTTVPELLDEKRRELQEEHLFHPQNFSKRFVCDPAVRELWHRADLKTIFPRWNDAERERLRQLHIISFTILVFIRWPIHTHIFRSIFIRDSHVDSNLPFQRDKLDGLGEQYIEAFMIAQYVFQPCIIRKSRRACVDRMNANQPWPFVDEPKKIGCGGYGDVWQAKIAKGCYTNESDQDNMINLNEKIVAYKHFSDGRDYHKEVQSLDYLRESLINHDHIAVHLAAIIHGKSDFFIFFELTPLGDLEVLLNGGAEPDICNSAAFGTVKYNFNKEFPQVRKVNFVEELANIASALEYLHETLPRTTTLGVYCAHMDLRPKNILVYPRSTGSPNVGKWVLADFGISSFKHREPGQRSLDFRTMGDFAFDTSRTGPHNLAGTHRAPELHELSDKKRYPGRKCDIWSFGCIANEVLAFLLGGLGDSGVRSAAEALREFRRQKSQGYYDDYWFEHETPSRSMSKAKLRTKVGNWLSTVPEAIGREQPEHAEWISQFVKLLLKTVNITPEARPLASDIGIDLREIIQIMETVSDSRPWASPDLGAGLGDDLVSRTHKDTTRPFEDIFDSQINFGGPSNEMRYDDLYSSSPRSTGLGLSTEQAYRSSTSDRRQVNDLYGSPISPRFSQGFSGSQRWPSQGSSKVTTPTFSGPNDIYGTSPGSMGPVSPIVSRLRSSGQDSLPDIAVTSSGSDRSTHSSDKWSISTGPRQATPRSQSPTSTADRPKASMAWLSRPEQSWTFPVPSNIKVFEIGPAGDVAAFIHQSDSGWKLSVLDLTRRNSSPQALDYIDMPDKIQWDRLSVTSRYIIAAGKIGTRREGRIVDLQAGQRLHHPNGWPWPCTRMTPSCRGVFAWTDSTRSVKIWNPHDQSSAPIVKSFKQNIDHITFNTTGTCLFVWARDQRTHFIYTINMLNPRAQPACTPFDAKLARPANKTCIWAAQSDHACLVQEASSLPRCYIRSDEESRAPPQGIHEVTPSLETSATALCDNWIATARVTGKFHRSLRVTKVYYSVDEKGQFSHASEEILLSDSIRYKGTFRIAACEEKNADRVVVCTASGGVWRFESPPNEKLRQRHGSFLK